MQEVKGLDWGVEGIPFVAAMFAQWLIASRRFNGAALIVMVASGLLFRILESIMKGLLWQYLSVKLFLYTAVVAVLMVRLMRVEIGSAIAAGLAGFILAYLGLSLYIGLLSAAAAHS